MRNVRLMGLVLGGMVLTASCSDSDYPGGGEVTMPVVKASLSGYEGQSGLLEEENDIRHIQAFHFKNGVLTKVYDDLQFDGSDCRVPLDRKEGVLYMLANAEGMVDGQALLDQNLTEAEWKETVLPLKNGKEAHFFSGSLSLDGAEHSRTELPLLMKRGVARFDLEIQATGSASVKSLTLKRVAKSVYAFPKNAAFSPPAVERRDTAVVFSSPLAGDAKGVLYVYEQENDGLELSLDVVIDGEEKTLVKTLDAPVKRNTVNTIVVRRDYINVDLNVTFDEWEEGSDIELDAKLKS